MKLKITIFFILLSLLTIVILLVNKRDSSDFQEIIYDNSRNYTYVPLANIGLSIGIVNDEHDQLIENMNFELEGTENFQGTIALVNQNEEEKDYLIVPLINYKQKKIRLGEDYQDKIKITLKPKEIAFIPFHLEDLKEGFHDFIFFIVKDPDNQNISDEYRIATTGSYSTIRGTINIGTVKNKSFQKYKKGLEPIEETALDGILLTKNRNLKPWLSEEITDEEEIIDFNIKIGNLGENKEKYALVSLLDWNQTAVSSEYKVYFGELSQNSSEIIKGEINTQEIKKNAVSNYTTFLIPHPYEKVDPYNPEFFIQTSTRVGLYNQQN